MFWVIWCAIFCFFDMIMLTGNFYLGNIGLGIFYTICMITTFVASIGAYNANKESKRIKAIDEDLTVNYKLKYVIGQIDKCIGESKRLKANDEDFVVNHKVKYVIGQIDKCIGKTK